MNIHFSIMGHNKPRMGGGTAGGGVWQASRDSNWTNHVEMDKRPSAGVLIEF